jgi:V/A-type H+-transporting ATPase subunit E
MSLKKILNQIEKDAQKEIEEITKEIETERTNLLNKAKKKAEIERDRRVLKGKKEAELEKQRIISSANVEGKRAILRKKDDLISEVITAAEKKITEDTTRYEPFLKKLIDEAGIDDYEVYVRKEDRRLVKGYPRADDDIEDPGVIIRKKDGSLTIDNRVAKVVERKKKDLRVGIAKILFERE